jgi:HicA toxin of bacterial toxin-antitoxin,
MKFPRDLSGRELVQALGSLGYKVTRQSGSHLRLTTEEHGEHHLQSLITIRRGLERSRGFSMMLPITINALGTNCSSSCFGVEFKIDAASDTHME